MVQAVKRSLFDFLVKSHLNSSAKLGQAL